MATYEVKIGDRVVTVEAADNASDQEIAALAKQQRASTQDSGWTAAASGAVKGITANFDDEIFAGLRSVVPVGETGTNIWNGGTFSEAYNRNVKRYRRNQENLQKDNPKSFGAGEIGGAVAGSFTLGGAGARIAARAAPGLAARIARVAAAAPRRASMAAGAAGGAGGGAVAGFGEGQDFESRLRAAAQGGTLGGFMGGTIGGVIGTAAPFVKRYIDAVRGKSGEKEAARQLAEALKADGYDVSTPQGVEAAMKSLTRFDERRGATIADIGTRVRNRTATATRFPSAQQDAARNQISDRARGQSARLTQDVKATIAPLDSPISDRPGGVGRLDITKMSDELIESRAAMAKTDREKAFWENVAAEKSRIRMFSTEDATRGQPRRPGEDFNLAYVKDPNAPPAPGSEEGWVPDPNIEFLGSGYGKTYMQNPLTGKYDEAPEGTYNLDIFNKEGGLTYGDRMGTPGMLSALRELRRDAPDITRLTGHRVTGARARSLEESRAKMQEWSRDNPNATDAEAQAMWRAIQNEGKDPVIDMTRIKPAPPLDPGGRRMRMVDDKRVTELLKDPQGNGAIAVREAMRLEQADRARRAAMGEDLSGLPELRAEGPYTYDMVDKAKQYLDGTITRLERGAQDNAFTGSDMHNIIRFRNDLRTIMKETNPEYRQYLENYGDNSAMIKGLEEGPAYRGLSAEQIAKEQAERPKGAAELYRVGAARANVDRLEKASDRPGAAADSIAESDAERARLKALGVTDEEMEQLLGARTQEQLMQKLYDETARGGLPAMARREAEDAATGLPSINVPYNLASPVGWGGAMARKASDRLMLRGTTSVNESLLPMALSSGADAEKVLQVLQRAAIDELKRGRRGVAKSGSYGYRLGVPIGGAVAVNQEEEF